MSPRAQDNTQIASSPIFPPPPPPPKSPRTRRPTTTKNSFFPTIKTLATKNLSTKNLSTKSTPLKHPPAVLKNLKKLFVKMSSFVLWSVLWSTCSLHLWGSLGVHALSARRDSNPEVLKHAMCVDKPFDEAAGDIRVRNV